MNKFYKDKPIIPSPKPKPEPNPTPAPTPKPKPAPTPEPAPIPERPEAQENEAIIYNAISTEIGSANYFKIDHIQAISPIQVDIFNQMGQLVYHSEHYQENGDIFKGYSNVQGVLGKGQLLEMGTYFYILRYRTKKGEQLHKGFIFVK